jgi:hypothetical protein
MVCDARFINISSKTKTFLVVAVIPNATMVSPHNLAMTMVVGKDVAGTKAVAVDILPTGEATEVAEAMTMQGAAITPTVRATRLTTGETRETLLI